MRVDFKNPQRRIDARKVRQDALLQRLENVTVDQIDTYIEDNVNDLQSAKRVLKLLAKLVILKL